MDEQGFQVLFGEARWQEGAERAGVGSLAGELLVRKQERDGTVA